MHYQAVPLHLRVHEGKHLAAKTVVVQYLAEVAQNGSIGNGIKRHSHEGAECLAVVDGIFKTFIAQGKPYLEKIHPKNHFKTCGGATGTVGMIVRLDQRDYVRPRNDGFHLAQKFIATSPLLLVLCLQIRKCKYLFHRQKYNLFLDKTVELNQHLLSVVR